MDTGGEQRLVAGDTLGRVGLSLSGRLGVLAHQHVRLCMCVASFSFRVPSRAPFAYGSLGALVRSGALVTLVPLVSFVPFVWIVPLVSLLISYHQSPPARWWHEEAPRGGIRGMSVG
ncbi:hypothetical protein GCM10022244_52360 [Streptomyces gulbargensis]|uniref:Uncharacterized protein n=1 Tax=Streptomyces gulbargensis TaxID=364901 RepID=A0ABP7N653_9ACTN